MSDELLRNELNNFEIDEIIDYLCESKLINKMKMEVILKNLDKYDYIQICEIFEGKLPFQLK